MDFRWFCIELRCSTAWIVSPLSDFRRFTRDAFYFRLHPDSDGGSIVRSWILFGIFLDYVYRLFDSFINLRGSLVLSNVQRSDNLLLPFRYSGEFFFVLERLVE